MTRSYRVANAVAAVALLVATVVRERARLHLRGHHPQGPWIPPARRSPASSAGTAVAGRRSTGPATWCSSRRPRAVHGASISIRTPALRASSPSKTARRPAAERFHEFQQPSINDAGRHRVLRRSREWRGRVRRARPARLRWSAVAVAGDAAPGGGVYESFDGVSRINAAGDVAFLATVSGGPSGIFLYDAGTTLVSSVARVGDATLDGREICAFIEPAVGLGATGTAFQAITMVSCVDVFEDDRVGIYRDTGLGIDRVALEGEPTPVGGTTYATFLGDPDLNASDQVLFRATIIGAVKSTGVFLFDAAGPTTTTLARTGDAAPPSGVLRTITEPSLTDGGPAPASAPTSKARPGAGIFLYDGVDEAVVLNASPVPTDIYLPGSIYRKIFEEIGIARSGTWVTYSATVDQPGVGTRLGLFRCEGS